MANNSQTRIRSNYKKSFKDMLSSFIYKIFGLPSPEYLRKREADLDRKGKDIERAARNANRTLQGAGAEAKTIISNAKVEAAKIIKAAEVEAAKIKNDAEEEAAKIKNDAEVEAKKRLKGAEVAAGVYIASSAGGGAGIIPGDSEKLDGFADDGNFVEEIASTPELPE